MPRAKREWIGFSVLDGKNGGYAKASIKALLEQAKIKFRFKGTCYGGHNGFEIFASKTEAVKAEKIFFE